MFQRTALDLWQTESQQPGIVSFCKDLDLTIGTGIPLGLITEFCGPPGSGKTQFCLQLTVNVQIPRALGGLEGQAAYIDTNYGFSPQRLEEMTLACIEHCRKLVHLREKDPTVMLARFTVATALDGVLYTHVTHCSHLLEAIAVLRDKLHDGAPIKLIVIDSLSFLIRNTITRTLERIQVLHQILTELAKLATRYGCAVVVTNDVTTRITECATGNDTSTIVPALGDSHTHKINQRILLGREEMNAAPGAPPVYIAVVQKSVLAARVTVGYTICPNGIRGRNNRNAKPPR